MTETVALDGLTVPLTVVGVMAFLHVARAMDKVGVNAGQYTNCCIAINCAELSAEITDFFGVSAA